MLAYFCFYFVIGVSFFEIIGSVGLLIYIEASKFWHPYVIKEYNESGGTLRGKNFKSDAKLVTSNVQIEIDLVVLGGSYIFLLKGLQYCSPKNEGLKMQFKVPISCSSGFYIG